MVVVAVAHAIDSSPVYLASFRVQGLVSHWNFGHSQARERRAAHNLEDLVAAPSDGASQ